MGDRGIMFLRHRRIRAKLLFHAGDGEIRSGTGEIAFEFLGVASIGVDIQVIRLELDRLCLIGNRSVEISFLLPRVATIYIRPRRVRT